MICIDLDPFPRPLDYPSSDMELVTGARDKFSIFCYGTLVFAGFS